MLALTKATYAGQNDRWFSFDLGHGFELRLAVLEAGLARVVMRRHGAYRLDRGWSIAPNRSEPGFAGRLRDDLSHYQHVPCTAEAKGQQVVIRGGGLRAVVRLDPLGISWFREGEAEPFLSDRATQSYFHARHAGGFRHFTARDKAERHFGVGDKSGPLDHTGRRFLMDACDPCGFDAETSDPLYKVIPFVIIEGAQGYHGLFYDNLARGALDLGAMIDNYHGLFRYYEAEDGDLDYYVLSGPSLADVATRFSWLTGGQALPPRWTLGFGMTSMALADATDADAKIAEFVDECERHDIPCRSFHFGSGYTMRAGKRYAFAWNLDKFPDPAASLAWLHKAGLHVVANLKPCLLDDHPRFAEAQGQGALVRLKGTGEPAMAQFWDGMGAHLDFTAPQGRQWWQQGIVTTLLNPGIDTVWNDNNEYEIHDEDAVCAGDGRPFSQDLARAGQALLMTKLAYEVTAAQMPGRRPFTITRGGAAGLGRYGQTWSGDNATAWKTLRFNLTQGLNMSLSGMYNIGHDVGGFHGPPPGPELLARFVEFCGLWPRFVMNSWNDDGTTTTPWLHESVLPQIKAVMALREKLLPTLYTLMWRAAAFDEPVVRPLFYDFPADRAARDVSDAFMLGADLLVAPVLEQGEVTRRIYLPQQEGGWYEVDGMRHHPGGAMAEIDAPLGRLPVLARAGALLAMAAPDGLDVLVVPGPAVAEGVIYLDDGSAAAWREGAGLEVNLKASHAHGQVRIEVAANGAHVPDQRGLRFILPKGATVEISNDSPLAASAGA
ncbi:MAG: glycoside hydrolase family 31 protein [Hyphomicrobiales bacterium]|nr:glycoside hydrolase family 31 protein [Hyphomicrobiales bacterium]